MMAILYHFDVYFTDGRQEEGAFREPITAEIALFHQYYRVVAGDSRFYRYAR